MADTPTPQITITGSGITTTNIPMSKIGSSAQNYSADYTVPSGNATCTMEFTAGTDLAGNTITITPQQNSTFTIDNTPPAMSITAKNSSGEERKRKKEKKKKKKKIKRKIKIKKKKRIIINKKRKKNIKIKI